MSGREQNNTPLPCGRKQAGRTRKLNIAEGAVNILQCNVAAGSEHAKHFTHPILMQHVHKLVFGSLVVDELKRRCLTLREEVEHFSEKQEVLVDLMVSKKDMQKEAPEKYQEKIFEEFKEVEELRAKEALALVQNKHMLIKCERERERARIIQRLEEARATVVLAHLLLPGWYKRLDEVTSESSWTALAKGKERDWWSIDLEGEVEKLDVSGLWFATKRRLRGTQRGDGPQVIRSLRMDCRRTTRRER